MRDDLFLNLLDKSNITLYRGDQDRILYENGLAFSIESLVKNTILECSIIIQDLVDRRIPASEYSSNLKKHFGVDS